MNNVKYSISKDNKTLTVEIDLTKRFGLSGTGNTVTIGSTQGNIKIGVDDIALGVSCYTKQGLAKEQAAFAKEQGYGTWAEYQAALKGSKKTSSAD